jgi:uncharacterized protein (TIGR02996 family)
MPPSSLRPPPRPEVLAFLADIKNHPQEDGLRLIFADWLEENGDPLDQARAELIRSQIEFSRLPPDAPGRPEHGRRQRALQTKYTNAWLGPLTAWGSWLHQRGLLSGSLMVTHLRSQALTALAGTETWAWVEELYLAAGQDSDVSRLKHNPLLAELTSLGFHRGLGPAGVQALAALPLLARLDKLILNENDVGDQGLRALSASPHLERLRTLELSRTSLAGEGVIHLASAAGLPRLERLNLAGNRLGDDGVAILASTQQLLGLQMLDLRSNLIGDAGATALSQSPALASLRELNLADNQLGPVAAHALAGSPHLEGIVALVLWGNPIGPKGVEDLRQRFGSRVHVSTGRF